MRRLSETLDHFHEFGWARLPGAIAPEHVAAMVDAVWEELARGGIDRENPASWTEERPTHLQRLKKHPAFKAIGSPRVRTFIDAALERASWDEPPNWGAAFLAFPVETEWNVPISGWHLDAKDSGSLRPARGVKTLALLSDVAPRGGATLIVSGSHKAIAQLFENDPLPLGSTNAEARQMYRGLPIMSALHEPAPPASRISFLMDRPVRVAGYPQTVVEATGAAGDVIVMHPLTLHAASPNCGSEPRLMISGGVTTDMWGWDET